MGLMLLSGLGFVGFGCLILGFLGCLVLGCLVWAGWLADLGDLLFGVIAGWF